MPSDGPRVLECDSAVLAQLGEEILQDTPCMRFRVRGSSMYPAIRNGDVIWVHSCDAEGLAVGEIAFIKSNAGTALVHRIIARKSCRGQFWLVTKGDARLAPDGPVDAGQVIGKAVMVERFGAHIRLDTRMSRIAGSIRNRLWPFWFRIRQLAGRMWPRRDWTQPSGDPQPD